jgi:exopolysaccharide biosynthesis protein
MKRQFFILTTIGLLLVPIGAFGRLYFLRSPRISTNAKQLFPGIVYWREARSMPRPAMVHIATIDLNTSGLKVIVTPKQQGALTTSDFLKKFKLKLAINASYFSPFYERTPWDYYPRTGDRAAAVGEVIANGDRYSTGHQDWAVLCISSQNVATIAENGTCPPGTLNGIVGRELLVRNGRVTPEKFADSDRDKPYPRIAVGIDRSGKKLWLVIVDGKQPLYSEGFTKAELAKLFTDLQVDKAVNFDGGGSTTLAIAAGDGAQVLNAPIHVKLPTTERPVANQIGFYVP